jgi:non-canonical purine NTP pyrophosphatase (RdgB/HAM1 family)
VKVTFITGNPKKAEFLSDHLGLELAHHKLELDEPQSLDLRQIAEHKVRQAYEYLKQPVLVEDTSFVIDALGRLPGPFIKWFIEELGFEKLCRLADPDPKRGAGTEVCYAYYDGYKLEFFSGSLRGSMPEHPRGDDGFGWNCVFIPAGQSKTNAEMSPEEVEKYSVRTTKVYPALKKFLLAIDGR